MFFFKLTLTPKIAQKKTIKGPKKCKRGPKYGCMKPKDRAVFQEPELIVYIGRSQKKLFNLTPIKKKALKGPKKAKKPPSFVNLKTKR